MTKHEFLNQFSMALQKNHVRDAEEVLSEYEQHFELKEKDGYPEEEIAARLGEPGALALQFEGGESRNGGNLSVIFVKFGLGFLALFAGMFFALLCLWELVMAVFSLTCGVLAVGLASGWNPGAIIPPMPLQSAVLLGAALLALAVLAGCGCIYFLSFLRQLLRAYRRFHSNALAGASGGGLLPALSIYPQLEPRKRRQLRTVFLLSLAAFAALTVAGLLVSVLSAGAIEFWHRWDWFV